MKDKVCLITGGNAGIGKATALELAKRGATVVLLCRSKQRGEEAAKEIIAHSGNQKVDVIIADLSSQQSVRQAVEQFNAKYGKLHLLINNAAVFLAKREVTEDGIEKTFATNYLSHFLLTHLLLDLMKQSCGARIINVASKHYGIKLNLDDLMLEKTKYSTFKAVGPTKLGLVIFAKEMAKRLKGTDVTINSLHPGLIKTTLLKQMPLPMQLLFSIISSSPAEGAETPVYLATSSEVQGVSGQYFEKCKPRKTSPGADDEATNKRFWDMSMKLAGLRD
ncbi:NAD(P)-dependent dehydrogenase (short-subunit alcohol dehydrogenase family) [Paenibacillus taihuensis]|uniref:NAD(P)-dependent dehydrogenase (Short-subunit alcohol dehydrogenase family) n=1 Tax=Paenibacillus taihuensis TaxID=1156355 RepID=A0A3D9R019_9BACL|nr:SDR family oxidoreductase [Paenibacillus taihuensis]REE66727.1 NAD(P)-dependent dehydrogenase (short-subunit alcohol dehydrogenase family) [Paenibacillus taihuensis]